MCFDKEMFKFASLFQHAIHVGVNAVSEFCFTFSVTYLATVGDVIERALNLVIREFYTAFRFIGHMTIGTRYASSCMYTQLINFVVGVLGFDHWCLAQRMSPVAEFNGVVILFHILCCHSIVPWKGQIRYTFKWFLCIEIIFHMALSAH